MPTPAGETESAPTALARSQAARRRRVLDATLELAAGGGFDAVQMRDVAAAADVALGTLYRYFSSKERLLLEAMVEQQEDLRRHLEAHPAPGATAVERVVNVLNRANASLRRYPDVTAAMVRAFGASRPDDADIVKRVGVIMTAIITGAIGSETERDRRIARVLQQVWLSSLVGWVGGVDPARRVDDDLDAAARLLLEQERRGAGAGPFASADWNVFYFRSMAAHYNFADLIELAVDKVPDREALVDHRRRITYRELDERANRFAHALLDAGVKPGDHVGIDAMNCIEWVEAAFALYKMRAVPVNVNFRYVEEELRYLFENSDMVGIVYQREFGPLIAKARDAQPLLQRFWRIDDGTDADDSALDAEDFEAAVASGSPARDWPERSDDDIYLLYTGGTTGMPKGVMWRQEDVYYALGGGIDVFTNERVTSPTTASDKIDPSGTGIVSHPIPPMMHGAGQFSTYRMLFEGGTVVYRPRFDPDDVWRTIERERVNVIGVTGDAMARPLADALERMQGDVDLSSLLSFGSTAAIFSQTVKEQLRELLGPNLVMTDAIGSTETGMNGIRVVQTGDAPKEGITTVLASADTTVLDDDMRPMEPGTGKVGRLARGGNIPLGYYRDPEKTAATFVTDVAGKRWSIPGDYATIEADGRITLMGRGSVSINSGGEKIYPEEVEGALKAHPDVFDVLVVGVPDERWGERVTAVVQPRPGHTPVLDDLVEHCRTRIASYKIPRQVFLVETVPRLPNGKPDYTKAKATALERVAGQG